MGKKGTKSRIQVGVLALKKIAEVTDGKRKEEKSILVWIWSMR